MHFDQWPPKEIAPTAFYFAADGSLTRSRPKSTIGSHSYRPDPDVRPRKTLGGTGQDDSWQILPNYDWAPLVDGTALAYATPPLDDDVTIVGPSSIDLWLSSSATDTDIQVTLTEIRPDGKETYVQNGWLRASHRRLDRKTTTILEPRQSHLERQASPLTVGRRTRVRVGLYAVAHVFRKGSRIRISIEAPGGDRTRWTFETLATHGAIENTIALGGKHASRIVLPVIPGVVPPEELPPCPSLRGQPCRTYVPATNGG
jgi:putative CocE/NonD family hydrolase